MGAGWGLSEIGSGLLEAGSGLSDAGSGLTEACFLLLEADPASQRLVHHFHRMKLLTPSMFLVYDQCKRRERMPFI